jgi:hypothetical protein
LLPSSSWNMLNMFEINHWRWPDFYEFPSSPGWMSSRVRVRVKGLLDNPCWTLCTLAAKRMEQWNMEILLLVFWKWMWWRTRVNLNVGDIAMYLLKCIQHCIYIHCVPLHYVPILCYAILDNTTQDDSTPYNIIPMYACLLNNKIVVRPKADHPQLSGCWV